MTDHIDKNRSLHHDPMVIRRKLRIALCGARGIPHTYGGAEAFFVELAPRLVERGHEVIVYCRRSPLREKPPYFEGVRLIIHVNPGDILIAFATKKEPSCA